MTDPNDIPEFNLGDFIEGLPYEDGPGSPDEYIANQLIIRRLELRNEEIRPRILDKGKRYLASSDARYYVNISQRSNFLYSKKIAKLEADLKALRAHINAKKKIEEQHGDAVPQDPTTVVSVRSMTPEIMDAINRGNDLLHPESTDDL